MPIFEFKCLQCGHLQEFILKNAEDTVEIKCEKCGSEELTRVLSRVSYAMSSPSGKATLTSKQCGSNTCTTMTLPGVD
ncbi:MAG: zinc ribbon domain-containing protein [Desulfonauticus sp.]|nr:zinc ribbon domain-containing protein [Desulfonauticus sp.]